MDGRLERYLARTEADERGCLNWKGYKTPEGYGRVTVNKKTVQLTRWIWEKIKGPIPDGMVVRHRCDNPPCINIEHLELGTHADNARDKAVRERAIRSIPTDLVPKVKAAVGTMRSIGARFGISASMVCMIKSGHRRQHVTEA